MLVFGARFAIEFLKEPQVDVRIPGEGNVNELLFSAHDPLDTGRPIRLTMSSLSKDNETIRIEELGGYVVQTSEAKYPAV